ncbi:MAG: hypothetical protein NT124_04845 [Candidatus Dependentiae bacterium]|nr:hypothetical protein [Candidatus Dependentiae bacterium]
MKKISIYVGFFVCCMVTHINAFDCMYYIEKHNLAIPRYGFGAALDHFAKQGSREGLQTSETQIDNTNFDWEYYVEHNGLIEIKSEDVAYDHYQRYGKWQKLAYCKQFDIVILLHLYDLDIMDEMIGRINYFIKNNPLNTYRIKINVPVDARILKEISFYSGATGIQAADAASFLRDKAATLGAEHKELIVSPDYSPILYNMYHYLQKAFLLDQAKIQVVFSENRGMDIGGFFVLCDELKKEDKPFDFVVKVHTKKGPSGPLSPFGEQFGQTWRLCLLSFLNIKINKVLRTYDSIYSCKINIMDDPAREDRLFIEKNRELFDLLCLSKHNQYDFCGGTMFIASHDFINCIQKWDKARLYFLLEKGRTVIGYEHVFERLFGYVNASIGQKALCLDFMPRGSRVKHDIT